MEIIHWVPFQQKLFNGKAKEAILPCDLNMSFDSKSDRVSLSDTFAKCPNMGKASNICDLKPDVDIERKKTAISPISLDIKKRFQNNFTDNTKNTNTSENISNDEFINAKSGYLKCVMNNAATMRATILLTATFCCTEESSTVFYQSFLRNKRIYLNTRVLPRYVCMNDCNDSYKVVNILQNDKKMDFRASTYAPNVLNKQTGYRIPNLSRLTIYLTKLYRTILIPILFLSNDHIKTLTVPNGYVFSLDIYFDSCLLIVL